MTTGENLDTSIASLNEWNDSLKEWKEEIT